jgi:exonuclease III
MKHSSIRLISWNIAGRVKACQQQLSALLKFEPDIVALQEVRRGSINTWRSGLENAGYYVANTTNSANEHVRQFSVLTASNFMLERLVTNVEIPFPERFLSVRILSSDSWFELHNCHIPPGSSQGWKKIETFEGLYKLLACKSKVSRILCGDFNSPQAEFEDGRIATWGQRIKANGEISLIRNHDRWDSGERSVIEKLKDYDLVDVFRDINGYEQQEYSWHLLRKGKVIAKRRYDHIFASRKLNPLSCYYLHDLRRDGLSDHSAIQAIFDTIGEL